MLNYFNDVSCLSCRHQAAIEEICRCASRELELEAKMRSTEEEWTEQVENNPPYILLTYFREYPYTLLTLHSSNFG